MIDFYTAGILSSFKLNSLIIELYNSKSPLVRDDARLKAVYGSFPNSIFNGGRLELGFIDRKSIEEVLAYYKKNNISIHFTYTNCLLEEHHFKDAYCNMILELAHDSNNGVIVNDLRLSKYIRENYPNYKHIVSTTTDVSDVSEINQLTKEYDLVVPSFKLRSIDELMKIEDKDKIELLAFDFCDPYCKARAKHYELISEYTLNYKLSDGMLDKIGCPRLYNVSNYKTNPYCIAPEDLKYYESLGFNKIKLSGRGLPQKQLAIIYADYFSSIGNRDALLDYLINMI